ncbi:ectonucleoside triphosphate diphosphohydrolase 6-like [Amphiura filiformis]|uniref:ectonucleoside triphosphate diphosphohydrolase 6-like n=1 Tax=Amphiura filiformis TaxID=82378 RepID=UPI003B213C07
MAIIKRSPALHLVTAIVTILLLMAFTVFSVGIFADDKPGRANGDTPEEKSSDEVTTRGIHYFQSMESIESIEEDGDDFYIVVFDVGSTGTRAHVFHFGRQPEDNKPVLLSDDVYRKSVALSDLVSDPKKSAEQCLSGLVSHLTTAIPKSSLAKTQVLFQGTESLRQLQEHEKQKLLQAAYGYLQSSPLLVTSYDDTFGILDGSEEGLYQWMTINYVNGVFQSTNSSHPTYGVIGIGGGSVQLVFQPTESKTLKETLLSKQLQTVDLFHHSVRIFTQSYSGLGRVESRLGIIQTEERIRSGLLKYQELSTAVIELLGNNKPTNDPSTLFSVCLPPGYNGDISFDSSTQNVAGITLPHQHNIHNICTVLITVFLDNAEEKPKEHFPEINTEQFYVLHKKLGHFIPKRKKSTWSISMKDIDDAARRACRNPDLSEPFACIDLVYVYTLLHHGFGFSPDRNIHIDTPVPLQAALSWALGFAVDWLQKHPY